MKIKKISLKNYKGHKNLALDLNPNLTVIVGENGAGKSSILDAISTSLSWIVARIKNPKSQGKFIDKLDIHNGAKECYITSNFDEIDSLVLFNKSFTGSTPKQWSYYEDLNEYVANVHSLLANDEDVDLPVFAYYGVKRAVVDVPLRIRRKEKPYIVKLYENWEGGNANFRSFFEWFRNEEDIENERKLANISIFPYYNENKFAIDRELSTVRRALEIFMPQYTNIRVERKPLKMLVNKGNEKLFIEQLSDGEKIYLALIGDLCHRLVLANSSMIDPLQGEGIVLIDEVDLHLHPNWQKDIAVRLTEVFPNIQFVLTTHSPLVLTNVPSKSVRLLKDNEVMDVENSYGMPTAIILKDKMGLTNEFPLEVENLIKEITKYIDTKDVNNVKNAYHKLQQLSPDHPELVRFDFFINRLTKI